MSLVLTGLVNGMRPVGGVVEQGPRTGEVWHFMSMEIVESRYGKIYSCQLNNNDKQYKEMVNITKATGENGKEFEKHTLKPEFDFTGHKVKVTIKSITAGERDIKDRSTGEVSTVIQIRTQITNIRDMGEPDDDE